MDERGSVISVSDSSGAALGINTYDEYGKPGAANLGRYQYTGQKWIAEANAYDYHARDYLPHLGIFAQTDPAGPVDGPNLYAYVLDDPVNLLDPLGLETQDLGAKPGGNCSPGDQTNCILPGVVPATGIEIWGQRILETLSIDVGSITMLPGFSFGPMGLFAAFERVSGNDTQNQCPTAQSINNYLASKGSPVAGYGQEFVSEGQKFDIDPRLPIAIMGAETGFGRHITGGSNNLFNNLYKAPLPSDFDSYTTSIHSEFHMLSGPTYIGRLDNTADLYGKYCNGPGCSAGLNNLNTFLHEQGGNPNSLHNPCLNGGK